MLRILFQTKGLVHGAKCLGRAADGRERYEERALLKVRSRSEATRRLKRVLPIPGGPVRVSKRMSSIASNLRSLATTHVRAFRLDAPSSAIGNVSYAEDATTSHYMSNMPDHKAGCREFAIRQALA